MLPAARKLLEQEPRTFNALRAALSERFPDANERGLGYAARTHLPLTMVPTDDRWGFPRDARFELAKANKSAKPAPLVRRYLAAFGPASAADVQTWSGLRALGEVLEGMDDLERFEGPKGRTLYDLPTRPGPTPTRPPRSASCPSSTTSCSPTPTARACWTNSTARAWSRRTCA